MISLIDGKGGVKEWKRDELVVAAPPEEY